MRVKVLASGSKGNSTYLESNSTRLLIDMGINYITVKKELEELNVDSKKIDGILITHTHSDHIKGLASFIKKTNSKVYVPLLISNQLKSIIPIENIVVLDEESEVGSFKLGLLHTSHDAPGSVGYIIKAEDKTLVYVTDTGYINEKYYDNLTNADIYILESNHDEQMLMNGPYPFYLKQRILSDEGHLSNYMTAKYLSSWVGSNTKYIVLAHLSEHNNTKDLAYETVHDTLLDCGKERDILIATQTSGSEVIEI